METMQIVMLGNLRVPTSSLFTFSYSRMLTLVLLSSHLTLSCLRYSHISAASMCLMSCCLRVHPSAPYVITVHTRHLRSLSFRLVEMFLSFQMFSSWTILCFPMASLALMSLVQKASWVLMEPRYLKCSTLSTSSFFMMIGS